MGFNWGTSISGGISGAQTGGSVGGGYGALIGGAIGAVGGGLLGGRGGASVYTLRDELRQEQAQYLQNYQTKLLPVIGRYLQTVNNLPSTTALYQGRQTSGARSAFSDAARQTANSQTVQGARVGSGRFNAAQENIGLAEGATVGRTAQAAKDAIRDEQAARLSAFVSRGQSQLSGLLGQGETAASAEDARAREDKLAAEQARQAYAGAAGSAGGLIAGGLASKGAQPSPPSTNYLYQIPTAQGANTYYTIPSIGGS